MNIKKSPAGFKNVAGPLVEMIQAKLSAAGFNPGPIDGAWGGNTMTALIAWQQSQGLPGTGIVDDASWTQLTTTSIPALSRRALQLTGDWEGTGYGGANGNFDGQGITWGVVGFTWKNGELQGILQEIQAQQPAIYQKAFGALAAQMTQILGQPRPQQMEFARSISIAGGQRIQPAWSNAFLALGQESAVQDLENTHAQHYWNAGMTFANDFNLTGERGLALCFDIAVQNTVSDSMIAEIVQKTNGLSEEDKLPIIAHVVAEHANPVYYSDVLQRKMTFATGQGKVHGDLYDITCWGIG